MLVHNVGLKGKNKLADKWEKEVYFVVDQPNKDVPVLSMGEAPVNCFTDISFYLL